MRYPRLLTVRNVMVVVTALVLLLGALAVFTASSYQSVLESASGSSTRYLVQHLVKMALGMILAIVVYVLPQETLKRLAPFLYVVSVMMLAALIALKGSRWVPEIKGSARWLVLPGGLRVMPSELARISYVLLAAALVSGGTVRARTGPGVTVLAVLAVLPAALTAAQPDFAGGMYMMLVMVVMLYLAEARLKDMAVLLLVLLALATVVVFSSGYRRQRVISWFSPGEETETSNYQPEQACIALGSGGLMGRGIGRGRQQRGFLPEAFSDYILAVVGEETGLMGVSFLLILLGIMIFCGWLIADGADHLFGFLLAGGLTASMALGMFMHVGVVTRMLPSTGMPLPLVSWGGTNMLVTLGSLGMVARVARESVGR